MSIMDHSPTTGVVTVIVILIAIAALGALILGCWCYLRLQRISQSEDEESIVGDGETKEPFLLVQYSAKGPCVERKAKLTPTGPEVHGLPGPFAASREAWRGETTDTLPSERKG